MTTDVRTLFPSRAHLISAITDRDGYVCYLCKRGFSSDNRPTVEHVTPLSRGGQWVIGNLKLAHQSCNADKGDRIFLPDGTLEPKHKTIISDSSPVDKDRIMASHCGECESGRLLLPDEFCNLCGRGAIGFPWSTKLAPKDCPHSGVFWCWLEASGLIVREPASKYVFDGDFLDED